MESLLVLAAFSFNLACQPVQPSVHQLNFSQPNKCSENQVAKLSSGPKREKLELVLYNQVRTEENPYIQKISSLAASLNPTIHLNDVSWTKSDLTEQYDPRVSISLRRAENNGYIAMLKVTIPL